MPLQNPTQPWNYETARKHEVECDFTNKELDAGEKFITVMVNHDGTNEEMTYSKAVCETLFDPLMYLFSKYSLQEIGEIHEGLKRHLAPPAKTSVRVEDKDEQCIYLDIDTKSDDNGDEYVMVQKRDNTGLVLDNAFCLFSFEIVQNFRKYWWVEFKYKVGRNMFADEQFKFEPDQWSNFLRCVQNKAIDKNKQTINRQKYVVKV